MALFQDSGQSPERRKEEAEKLLTRLSDALDSMTDREKDFHQSVSDAPVISPKQLFWLRDLCDKYSV